MSHIRSNGIATANGVKAEPTLLVSVDNI